MDYNIPMCSSCEYVFKYISNKIFMERERIVDKILIEQNKMLYERLTKIMMIHSKEDSKMSLYALMKKTEVADQIYDKISIKLKKAVENILIKEIMELELCCEEKVFEKSRDRIQMFLM